MFELGKNHLILGGGASGIFKKKVYSLTVAKVWKNIVFIEVLKSLLELDFVNFCELTTQYSFE